MITILRRLNIQISQMLFRFTLLLGYFGMIHYSRRNNFKTLIPNILFLHPLTLNYLSFIRSFALQFYKYICEGRLSLNNWQNTFCGTQSEGNITWAMQAKWNIGNNFFFWCNMKHWCRFIIDRNCIKQSSLLFFFIFGLIYCAQTGTEVDNQKLSFR